MSDVKPGQVYVDNDPRSWNPVTGRRTVRVERVDETGYGGNGRPSAWVVNTATGRGGWVLLSSFYADGAKRSRGYSLRVL